MRQSLRISAGSLDGREVYTLEPKNQAPSGKHVFYLHGGAYVRPITRHHWQFLQHLVNDARCTVTVPLYPLAPENQGTAALEFVLQAYLQAANGAGSGNVTIMGDSAGGGLAIALALALRDRALPLPAQLLLISPWVDVTLPHAHIPMTARLDPMLGLAGAREAGRLYAGNLPLHHPAVSPLHADFSDLPPLTLFIGTHDITHHDAASFAQKAESQGCQVDLRIHPGMIHVWPLLPFPEARKTREEIAKLLQR